MDVVIITPEPGMHKEIGQQLLGLADNPRDVQWVTWPQAGFAVPLSLFRLFDEGPATGGTIEPGHIRIVGETGPEEEAPKRRRRPRKETSTDNTTSEEE